MFTGQRYHCLALEKINVCKVSPSKQHHILRKLTMCARRRKTNAVRAKGSSLATSPIQQCRKIYAHNTVCLQSGRAQGILYVKSNLSNSSVQYVLIVNVHTLKKKGASRDIHTEGVWKSVRNEKYLVVKSVKEEWNVYFTTSSVCSAHNVSASLVVHNIKAVYQ